MPTKSTSGKRAACQYSLPPFPSLDRFENVDPFEVNLFLHIEVLMRNDETKIYYRTRHCNRHALLRKHHGIPWDVLKGEHHCILSKKTSPLERIGVLNFSGPCPAAGETILSSWVSEGKTISIRPDRDPCSLYLKISVAYSNNAIWSAIEPLVLQRRKELFERDRSWQAQRLNPKPMNPATWRDYFKCYDLKTDQPSLTFGDIGKAVYSKESVPKRYALARTAMTRATKAIADPYSFV